MLQRILSLIICTAVVLGLPLMAQAYTEKQNKIGNVPVVSNRPHKAGAVPAVIVQERPSAVKKHTITNKNTNNKKSREKEQPDEKSFAAGKQNINIQQSNWRLKVAQHKLHVLGLTDERPNGYMTEKTSKALKNFQKQYKLKEHGQLDDITYRKLVWEAFKWEGIPKLQGRDVVNKASKYKGVPYIFGGTTPKGFDCSGYVQYVFKECKANLPRLADEQALEGIFVTQKQLQPGDLVFFTTYAKGASHVGIYAGAGKFWSASSSRGVVLSSLKDTYWKERYYGARRVLIANGEVK